MTTKQEESFLHPNPGTVALKIQEMVRKGWTVDEDRPMTLLGFQWEVWFKRDATDEQLAKDEADLNKPSRADILRKAREAKAAKKNEQGEQPQTEEEEAE